MISVTGDDRLKAAVLVMRQIDAPTKREIGARTRTTMNPVWRGLVAERAQRFTRDRKVLDVGVRIAAGNPPAAVAAGSRRRLSGGLLPADQWRAFEFGSRGDRIAEYRRRSPKGNIHRVRRNVTKQLPPTYRKGRIVYPAFAELAPRFVSLWVQTIVRTMLDALEKAAR